MGSRKPRERAVSEKEALSVIEKLKSGKSIMGEARRLGCYHATLRKSLRAALGSTEYAKVVDQLRHRRKLSPSAKPARREYKRVAPRPTPKRFQPTKSGTGDVVLRPLGVPVDVIVGKTVEVKLSETRVLLLTRLGESVRITAARRSPRTFSDALELGGTVILPRNSVSAVCDALLEAAG